MGCCLSKTDEDQDKIFDPNEYKGEYIIRLWPRKDRQYVERIETNKDTIVMSVDPEADDEKIVKDRDEALKEYGRRFLLE